MKKILVGVLAFCLVAGAMPSDTVKFVVNSIVASAEEGELGFLTYEKYSAKKYGNEFVSLGEIPITATAMTNNTEGLDLKQIYRDKLYELIETGWVFSDNVMFDGSRFDFYDIDTDGIPELVVTYNNSSHSGGFIYSIVNGKLTESEINVQYGSVAVNSEKHLVYYNDGNAYVPYKNYYRFSEGKLQDITDSGENFENITWDSIGRKYPFDELSIDEALDSIMIGTTDTNTTTTTDTDITTNTDATTTITTTIDTNATIVSSTNDTSDAQSTTDTESTGSGTDTNSASTTKPTENNNSNSSTTTSSPKTSVAGVGVATAGLVIAISTAFVLRKKND